MTTKIISSYYAAGYNLAANTNLYITQSGGVGAMPGSGPAAVVSAYQAQTVTNDGRIEGNDDHYGVAFFALGGRLTNGSITHTNAQIYGADGVVLNAVGTVVNFATISASLQGLPSGIGVALLGGGALTNGAPNDRVAVVDGYVGVLTNSPSVVVANFATIKGYAEGLYMNIGGTLTNGSVRDVTAVVQGQHSGLYAFNAPVSVVNYGAISGVVARGIYSREGGSVVNRAGAYIAGRTSGVEFAAAGTVTNIGLIEASGPGATYTGVLLDSGGAVTNGTAGDHAAYITGYTGVSLAGAGTVKNFGTISSLGGAAQNAVYLADGGVLANGSASDRAALLSGAVTVEGAAATITNAGTILSGDLKAAVAVYAGGSVVNGSLTNTAAVIEGGYGLVMQGGSATNFGTITGVIGVSLRAGAALVNGGAKDTAALIDGVNGLYAQAGAAETVTNFGTIAGSNGVALILGTSADVLKVEAHSTFLGQVAGGYGTLDLASGTGTLSNFGGGSVTVSGSMAPTAFENFATFEIGEGAKFVDRVAVTVAAGETVVSAGTLTLGAAKVLLTNQGLVETTGSGLLTIAGPLANIATLTAGGGTLSVNGAVTGTGVAVIHAGTLDLGGAFSQNVSFTGTTGVLELSQSQDYVGTISGFSKTGKTSLDLVDITFATGATTATFSGNGAGGILTVTNGTQTALISLKGNYTASTFTVSLDGHGGTSVIDPAAAPAASSPHRFIAAMAGLGGPAGAAIPSIAPTPGRLPLLLTPRPATA